jgi:hypothetical protein
VARVDAAPDLAERLTPIEVVEADGEGFTLGSLWRDHPAVLVHLRHFG